MFKESIENIRNFLERDEIPEDDYALVLCARKKDGEVTIGWDISPTDLFNKGKE
jgi:hypothetical protein